jgi:hypothetical protein
MAKKLYEESNIQSIAEAIRQKNGTSIQYKVSEMAPAILAIAGGGSEIPDEAFYNNYPNNNYRFYAANGTWLWENHAGRFEPLILGRGMFAECGTITDIPITLTIDDSYMDELDRAFYGCSQLKQISNFIPYNKRYSYERIPTAEMFWQCSNLRTIPLNLFGTCPSIDPTTPSKTERHSMFENCYSLRKMPDISMLNDASPTISTSIYSRLAHKCYCLDEVTNLPISSGSYNTNMFTDAFTYCHRIKNLTFATDNGTPKTANWTKQTIVLSYYTGYCDDVRNITGYNGGCSGVVNSSATYATYKNTEDWYSRDYGYSRYNGTSLINTINSLPDCSAYVAANGGTNTIKLRRNMGRYTDGGSVNSIGEANIALAASKGWTIAYTEYEEL